MPKQWTYEQKKVLFKRLDNLSHDNKTMAMVRHQGLMWVLDITTDIYFTELERIVTEYEAPQPTQPEGLIDQLNSLIDNAHDLKLDKGVGA